MKLIIALVCSCLFYQAFSQTEAPSPKCQGSTLGLVATSIQSHQSQLDEHKAKYHELSEQVSKLNAGPVVAFTAWVVANTRAGNVLKYSFPEVNVGNALYPNTGEFTVPLDGLYWFSFTGITTDGDGDTIIHFRVNGNTKALAQSSKFYYTLAFGGYFNLKAKDVVDILVYRGHVAGDSFYSTFSGSTVQWA